MNLRAAVGGLAIWLLATSALTAAPPTLQTLTTQERALLAAHPVLRLGVEGNWPPIEYYNEKGEYSGVLSGYMHAIEQRLGIRFELVTKSSWDEVLQAFERGEIDVLPALGSNEDRAKIMRFTDSFLKVADGIIVRSDEPFVERLGDLPEGKIIAAVQGFGSSERAIKNNPHLIVVPVATPEEALQAVSARRADVAIASLASAYYFTQTLGLSNLKVAANYDEYEKNLSMALRPEHARLVPIFNKALASILPGERQAIRNLWINIPVDRGIARDLVWLWISVGTIALLLLGSWVVVLIRQRRHNALLLARAEAAESRFRALVDAVPAVFWTLRPATEHIGVFDIFGAKDITIAGMQVQAFGQHFEHLGKHMLKEDRQRFAMMVQRHSKTMAPLQIEYRLFGPDGQVGWAYVHMLPKIEKGALLWYGCTFDITARKQLEQALEQSRMQLEEMASSVPGALWQFRREADGRQYYTYMSDGIINITGRTPAESCQLMVDKSFAAVHPDDLPIVQNLMQGLTNAPGTTDQARYRLSTTAGGWKWVAGIGTCHAARARWRTGVQRHHAGCHPSARGRGSPAADDTAH